MPKKIKQKISQKVIQKVIVKVGEMKKKRKARRRAKRAAKETEGVSSFRQGTTIPPSVTYVTQPTQFTPYVPKQFEEIYRTVKDLYGKKEEEQVGLMDLKPVAEPLKPRAKEVLEEKEIVVPVEKEKIKEIDVSNPTPSVIFSDPIKDKSLDYKPIAGLNIFPQEELNRNDDLYATNPKIEEEIIQFEPLEKKKKKKKTQMDLQGKPALDTNIMLENLSDEERNKVLSKIKETRKNLIEEYAQKFGNNPSKKADKKLLALKILGFMR